MKVVQINATCGVGSTGVICTEISRILTENGIENHILYCSAGNDFPAGIPYGDSGYVKRQAYRSYLLGNNGFNSRRATAKLIRCLDEIRPDIVQLHNIHGHSCHLEMLFAYLKEKPYRVFWTFHDCWAFTGYCPYFDMAACSKWQTQCENCPLRKKYSRFFDKSAALFQKKKALFEGVDFTVITPSQWLADLTRQSFLKDHPVKVIHNGIDLSVFRPADSDFRRRHSIGKDGFMLLGVAFEWEKRKGLDVFLRLAETLPAERYRIVLVGTNKEMDQTLPKNIISIHRTKDQRELAQLYTAADLFINPTREENYPTVNMEALACGTPVLTFPTGGSAEMLTDKTGAVVTEDIGAVTREVRSICESHRFSASDCVAQAAAFCDKDRVYRDYLNCYLSQA